MDATEDFDLAWAGAPTQLALTGGRTTDATLFAALKREKDRRQGEALLAAVRERMPHYPLDDAFRRELPPELGRYLPAK